MLGAIAGDIIGSVHEAAGTKTRNFALFIPESRYTDDTVLTIAVADALMSDGNYVDLFHDYFYAYPGAGYGQTFFNWAHRRIREPYGSWGNGSAMRVSPVAYVFDSLSDVLKEARATAVVTHNHPQGIAGAQATAAAVYLARTGASKEEIRTYIAKTFEYALNSTVDEIRQTYQFDVSCQGSVPQSIIAFLDSDCYESAVRNAISLGGDADTMACIAGAIAEAFYGGTPTAIAEAALERLPNALRDITIEFMAHYM
jgi:ADP-ribosylglycohydrolase